MTAKPFVLSVGAFITREDGRFLLVQRSDRCKHFRGCWETPGGKATPAESLDAVLQREVKEETGLAVEVDGVVGASEFDLPHLRVCALYFRTHAIPGEVRLSEEHRDHVWIRPDELQQRLLAPALENMRERIDLMSMFAPSESQE